MSPVPIWSSSANGTASACCNAFSSAYDDNMSLNARELYEAGLALPPSQRKDVALRLLDSVEVADQETVDQAWTSEISNRVADLVSGKVQTVPGEQVFAELAARRADHNQ